jgi:hypothetical protein
VRTARSLAIVTGRSKEIHSAASWVSR